MASQPTGQDSLAALKLAASEFVRTEPTVIAVCADAARCRQLKREMDFLLGEDRSLLFPDWESLPYDRLPASGNLVGERLHLLRRLADGWQGLLLTTPASLLQRLPPKDWLAASNIQLRNGQELSLDVFARRLAGAGYRPCTRVEAPGEFARRGALIDFFPAGYDRGLRVEFLDQNLESMRWFDAKTQRSTGQVEQVDFSTGREVPLDESGVRQFAYGFRTSFSQDEHLCPAFEQVCQGTIPDGLEYLLPLFFERTEQITDYMPTGHIVLMPQAAPAIAQLQRTARERYDIFKEDPRYPVLPPERLFCSREELPATFAQLRELEGAGLWQKATTQVQADPQALRRWLVANPGGRILCCAPNAGALSAMQSRLKTALPAEILDNAPLCDNWQAFVDSDGPLALARTSLGGGCKSHLPDGTPVLVVGTSANMAFASGDTDRARSLFAATATADIPDASGATASGTFSTTLREGQLVVHPQHGIGRYRGLNVLETDGVQRELATLEYRNQARLYLPIDQMGLLHPYRRPEEEDDNGDEPALDRLGSEVFSKALRKAEQQARDDAARLLAAHASRQAAKSDPLTLDDASFNRFISEFPFTETPDQIAVTQQVRTNLAATTPTNLLICGDVGFGKTEIAMRAAFLAAMSGRQCCIVVPTTLLCQQHYRSFIERMAGWPIRIAQLNSTLSASAKRDLQDQLKRKAVDILISTHSVLRGQWQLPSLGLVIIDEEHRFGVNDKERSRDFQISAHNISLTATPIPRSLHRSLSGLCDIAIMGTPPAGRLPVQTFVREWDTGLVHEALKRERMRGGQVFVVHDRISTLEAVAEQLLELAPGASLEIAHGRMDAKRQQEVMQRYGNGEIDILLSTTIIESGIDVPNANTLLVTRADRMGLAQLHQLRGRVGRSSRQAWCWLFHPADTDLSRTTLRRLEAIQRADDLGAGLMLAQEDLEIRGAGELLGRQQSGQVQNVGMDLYLSMLERAISDIRQDKPGSSLEDEMHACEIDLGDAALLPETYLPDTWERVLYYRKLSSAKDPSQLKQLSEEMRDRFGPLPLETVNLLRNARLRIRTRQLGGARLIANEQECMLEIRPDTLSPEVALSLVQKYPHDVRMTPKSLRARARAGGGEATAIWLLDRLVQEQQEQKVA